MAHLHHQCVDEMRAHEASAASDQDALLVLGQQRGRVRVHLACRADLRHANTAQKQPTGSPNTLQLTQLLLQDSIVLLALAQPPGHGCLVNHAPSHRGKGLLRLQNTNCQTANVTLTVDDGLLRRAVSAAADVSDRSRSSDWFSRCSSRASSARWRCWDSAYDTAPPISAPAVAHSSSVEVLSPPLLRHI